MASWKDEYLRNILDAEAQIDPIVRELVSACSDLTLRNSELQADQALQRAITSSPGPTPKKPADKNAGAETEAVAAAQLRLEVASSERAKTKLRTRLKTAEDEVARLRARTQKEARSIRDLTHERDTLRRKLKDKEFELREKKKLIEQVQDETLALNVEAEMALRQKDEFKKLSEDLKKDNEDLVRRWMKRKGEEAERMNGTFS